MRGPRHPPEQNFRCATRKGKACGREGYPCYGAHRGPQLSWSTLECLPGVAVPGCFCSPCQGLARLNGRGERPPQSLALLNGPGGMANLCKLLLNRSDMNVNVHNEEDQRGSSPRLPCVEESLPDRVYGVISTSNSRMVAATAQRCRHLARDHPAGEQQ